MNAENLAEACAVALLVVAKLVHYLWRRRQGFSRWDSVRPWAPLTRRPTPPWATEEGVLLLRSIRCDGSHAAQRGLYEGNGVHPAAVAALEELQRRGKSDHDIAATMLRELDQK